MCGREGEGEGGLARAISMPPAGGGGGGGGGGWVEGGGVVLQGIESITRTFLNFLIMYETLMHAVAMRFEYYFFSNSVRSLESWSLDCEQRGPSLQPTICLPVSLQFKQGRSLLQNQHT